MQKFQSVGNSRIALFRVILCYLLLKLSLYKPVPNSLTEFEQVISGHNIKSRRHQKAKHTMGWKNFPKCKTEMDLFALDEPHELPCLLPVEYLGTRKLNGEGITIHPTLQMKSVLQTYQRITNRERKDLVKF